MRSLSLCVIARDEEAMISGCLESVAGLADEIILVDTGSQDHTVELATAHGARIVSFPWRDDFSAARNAALEVAAGDFILFLDADERLEQASIGALRRLMEGESDTAPPTVYAPLILNVDSTGASLGADHMPRFWRARPELRFSGRVHEEVGRDLPGLRRAFEDSIRIIHLGYDPVLARARGKHERNIRLLDQELAQRPDDPALIFYRAKESYATGDDATAAEAFQKVIALAPGLNFALSSYVFAVECMRATGRAEDALAFALRGTRVNPPYSELWYAAGMAAMDAGLTIQAEALFREALKPSEGFALAAFQDPDIRAWRAEVGMGQALRLQGHPEQAVPLWTSVRERVPLGPERIRLDLDLIEVHLGLGQQKDAWDYLEPMLDTAPEEAVGPFLEFIDLYMQYVSPEDCWTFFEDAATVHPTMLRQLPLVATGIELAELLGKEDHAFDLLNIAVHLGSRVPTHYTSLARLLDARGETSAAETARRAARRLGGS